MRWLPADRIALLVLATACASQPPAHGLPPDPAVADRVALLATDALEADGSSRRADSLWAADAEIIADGHRRTGSPRFAGVGERGRVVVGSTRVDVMAEFAWASLRYQWFSADENLITEGQATLVLLRDPGTSSWRILHAHSSQGR
jgi:hypothetical protein